MKRAERTRSAFEEITGVGGGGGGGAGRGAGRGAGGGGGSADGSRGKGSAQSLGGGKGGRFGGKGCKGDGHKAPVAPDGVSRASTFAASAAAEGGVKQKRRAFVDPFAMPEGGSDQGGNGSGGGAE